MVRSTVIPRPDKRVLDLTVSARQYRCACCGGPALPILEWHEPRGEWPGYYLCHTCAQFCQVEEQKKGRLRFRHTPRPRLDWQKADLRWAVDLGFKKLSVGKE